MKIIIIILLIVVLTTGCLSHTGEIAVISCKSGCVYFAIELLKKEPCNIIESINMITDIKLNCENKCKKLSELQ